MTKESPTQLTTSKNGCGELSNLIIHRDRSETNAKRRSIAKDGIGSLHVVLDFDHTVTAYISPITGEKCPQCHDAVQHGAYDPPKRRNSFKSTIDAIWSDQDNGKLRHLSEWWIRFHDAIVSHELTISEIRTAVASSSITLRPGAADLFAWLRENSVKTTILSAGIITVIEEVLKRDGIELHEQACIVSNVPVSDGEEGRIISFQEPLVHALNKEEVLKTLDFGSETMGQPPDNVVLAGNSIGDVQCLPGIHHKRSLSLGFLHENVDVNIQVEEGSEICARSMMTADGSVGAPNNPDREIIKFPLVDKKDSNLEEFLKNYEFLRISKF